MVFINSYSKETGNRQFFWNIIVFRLLNNRGLFGYINNGDNYEYINNWC